MLTSAERRMYKNLRTMVAVITVVLIAVLMGQQEKEAMMMEINTPSVYEITQMEDMGYTYVVTDNGVGYFMK